MRYIPANIRTSTSQVGSLRFDISLAFGSANIEPQTSSRLGLGPYIRGIHLLSMVYIIHIIYNYIYIIYMCMYIYIPLTPSHPHPLTPHPLQMVTVVRNVKQAHECLELGESREFFDEMGYLLDSIQPKRTLPVRCLG